MNTQMVIRPLQTKLDEARAAGLDVMLCSTEIIEKVIALLNEQEQQISFLKAMQLQTVKGMDEQELGTIVGRTLGMFR